MQHRIVWPAILSIVGTYSPFFIAAVYFYAVVNYLGVGGAGFVFGYLFFFGGTLTGGWLLALSILLLFDRAHQRVWGIIVAVSYALAFLPLLWVSEILASPQVGGLIQLFAWPSMAVPVLGIVGGVWGFWKIRTTPAIQVKQVRPLAPALLSAAGTSLLIYYLAVFVSVLFAPPTFFSVGEGAALGFIVIPVLIAFVGLFVLIPVGFSIALWYDSSHRRTWAAILIVWWAVSTSYLATAPLTAIVTPGQQVNPWFAVAILSPLTGLVGAVWGFFWHTGWTSRAFVRAIVGRPGLAVVGGVVSALGWAEFAGGGGGFLILPPIIVIVGGFVLYYRPKRRRLLSVIILSGSLATGLLLPVALYVLYLNHLLDSYVNGIPEMIGVLFGSILSAWAAAKSLKRVPGSQLTNGM